MSIHDLIAKWDRDPEFRAKYARQFPDDSYPSHPEAFCQRCEGPNVWSWHAPAPLWNAVMRDPVTGDDAYSIVCPPCFAFLAAAKGFRWTWHFGPHEEMSGLWPDADGRVWDSERCLWVKADDGLTLAREGAASATGRADITAPDFDAGWDDGAQWHHLPPLPRPPADPSSPRLPVRNCD